MKAATTIRTDPSFHFIGGKGGVGKTTCAAAFAVHAARQGRRVLVASTDPAPSLGDALNLRLRTSPRSVPTPGRGKLSAVEIDASLVLARWINERREALERVALEGTWLDREDVARLLRLSLPGIDEIAALLELARLATTQKYDLIVVDTAPTGHTLRMLAMPETLFAIARLFDRMRDKHRTMVEALRGEWRPDDQDGLIRRMAVDADSIAGMLRDARRTRISWVTLPEAMAVAETTDAVKALETGGIRVSDLIVNRLTPPAGKSDETCGHCDARRAYEASVITNLPRLPHVLVDARDLEPTGVRSLAGIGADLHGDRAGGLRLPRGQWTAPLTGTVPAVEDLVGDATRLVLFGGKGGVGKTTCAAAFAMEAAARLKGRRVLLISIDPAHSLGDALGEALTDLPVHVRGTPSNLQVREMDAGRVFASVREKYAGAIDRLFDRIGGGSFDAAHDRSVMHGLIDLAPPGIDELAAIIEITDSLSRDGNDLVVLDTAPTGHALRLLEMPALIHDWTRALMAILLKYQPITGVGELGALLLALSQGLGRLRQLLGDRTRTGFVLVTRAASLPRHESKRLLDALARLAIHVPAVIVNAVGRDRCVRCRRAAARERREITALDSIVSAPERSLVLTAACVPPPRTGGVLLEWRRSGWRYHQNA